MSLALCKITGPGYVAIEAPQGGWSIGIDRGHQCFYISSLQATSRVSWAEKGIFLGMAQKRGSELDRSQVNFFRIAIKSLTVK
jgi:hypothetical protein